MRRSARRAALGAACGLLAGCAGARVSAERPYWRRSLPPDPDGARQGVPADAFRAEGGLAPPARQRAAESDAAS